MDKLNTKLIARFALIALLPLLSGCLSTGITQAANKHVVKTLLYDSVDRIEKAAITADDRLCVFFEKDFTNSVRSRFTLLIPLEQIRTNSNVNGLTIVGLIGNTNSYDLYSKVRYPELAEHLRSKLAVPSIRTNLLYIECVVTYAMLSVPGGTIQTNWTLLDHPVDDFQFVPIGDPAILPKHRDVRARLLGFPLLSNATETVYLTRTEPIEFSYVDASMKRSMTVVKVEPYEVSHTQIDHPGYYCWLALTVPVDIATSPLQAIGYAYMWCILSGLGHMH